MLGLPSGPGCPTRPLSFSRHHSLSHQVQRNPPAARPSTASGATPPVSRPPAPNSAKALSDEELSMTKVVEPTEASSTIQKYRKNRKVWPSKRDGGYWRVWLLGLPAVSVFPRPDQFLRAGYPTYFGRHNCSPVSAEFNVSETIEKYEDLM